MRRPVFGIIAVLLLSFLCFCVAGQEESARERWRRRLPGCLDVHIVDPVAEIGYWSTLLRELDADAEVTVPLLDDLIRRANPKNEKEWSVALAGLYALTRIDHHGALDRMDRLWTWALGPGRADMRVALVGAARMSFDEPPGSGGDPDRVAPMLDRWLTQETETGNLRAGLKHLSTCAKSLSRELIEHAGPVVPKEEFQQALRKVAVNGAKDPTTAALGRLSALIAGVDAGRVTTKDGEFSEWGDIDFLFEVVRRDSGRMKRSLSEFRAAAGRCAELLAAPAPAGFDPNTQLSALKTDEQKRAYDKYAALYYLRSRLLETVDTIRTREPLTAEYDRRGVSLSGVAFSPDGALLAAAGVSDPYGLNPKGLVFVWEAGTGRQAAVYTGHVGPALCVAFSPDGKRIASGGEDGTVRVWSAPASKADPKARPVDSETAILRGHNGPVNAVAFSPDGRWIASGGDDGYVRLWRGQRAAPPRYNLEPDAGAVLSAAFSADGKLLAAGGADGAVVVWELGDAGRPAARTVLKGHERGAHSVVFLPDSRRLVSAGADGTVCVWAVDPPAVDAVRDAPELRWKVDDPRKRWHTPRFGPAAAALSPNGRTLAVLFNFSVVFYDLPAAAAAPRDDSPRARGRLWDVRPVDSVGVSGVRRSLCFAPDGTQVATCGTDCPTVGRVDAPGRP